MKKGGREEYIGCLSNEHKCALSGHFPKLFYVLEKNVLLWPFISLAFSCCFSYESIKLVTLVVFSDVVLLL